MKKIKFANRFDRGIGELDVSTRLKRKLTKMGIVSCVQLHEDISSRSGVALSAGARKELETELATVLPARALETSRKNSREHNIPLVTGIVGPASDLAEVREIRRRHQTGRDKVVQRLQEIEKRGSLPREQLLTKWMTPVRSQGGLGSCTGWGSTANREFLARYQLSPRFAYEGAKSQDGMPHTEGSYQHYCFKFFYTHGHVLERDFPYTDKKGRIDIAPYLKRAQRFKSRGYSDVRLDHARLAHQPTLFKAILTGKLSPDLGPHPVSISVAVYPSWSSPSTRRYGFIRRPSSGETLRGGHAMCIVGYIDAGASQNPYDVDFFIVKNSWGEGWAADNPFGLPGYALFPASYFTSAAHLWEALVCLAEPSPAGNNGLLDLLRVTWANEHMARLN